MTTRDAGTAEQLMAPGRRGGRARTGRMRTAAHVIAVSLLGAWFVGIVTGTGPIGAVAATPRTEASRASAGADDRWNWPVDAPWHIVRGFEAPATPYSAGHRGIDLASHPGSPVFSPADGVVRFSGRVVDRPVITIAVNPRVRVSMEPVASDLAVGTRVHSGEEIGRLATGGHCDGRCVHVGVRLDDDYVSPLLFLAGIPRAVLLPQDE